MRDLRWFALQTMLLMCWWKDNLESMVINGVFKDADAGVVNVDCVVCLVGSNGKNIAFGMRYFELPGGGP